MDTAKVTDTMVEMTRNVLENMMKLQEINDRTVQQLAQKQFEAAGDYMSTGVRRLKTLRDAKDLKDALATQAELATELRDKMISHSQKSLDVLNASKEEMNQVMQSSIATFFAKAGGNK